ncbi:HNH endonuclease [Mycolicibacterium sp. A43C]
MTSYLSADGVEWTERLTRPAVTARSGGICECCGKQRATDKHHRLNASRGGQWHPANILDVCRLCHHRITVNPVWAESQGLSLPSGAVLVHSPAAIPVRIERDGVASYLWLTDELIAKAGVRA